ncbi:MAG TPA: PAS domain-containing protein [Actinomycetota bacterium]|nr:PAS domain-containing protein [Actinomycetota bacterium]
MARHLIDYRLRTVRVGVRATWLVVAGLCIYLVFASDRAVDRPVFTGILVVAAGGAAIIALLPWQRLLESRLGLPALYAWSVLDIVLITFLIEATGGAGSVAFVMYALTTVFFSASYPREAQIGLLLFTFASFMIGSILGDWEIAAAGMVLRFTVLVAVTYIVSFLSSELMGQNEELEHEAGEHLRTAALLSEVQRLARLGSWTWSPASSRFTSSEELNEIFGVPPEAVPRSPTFLIDHAHPEDRALLTETIRRAEQEGSSFILEHRIVRADGPTRILQAQGRVETSNGERIVIGTALDITERKRAEENDAKLRELENKRNQALQINDNLVQGLTVAKYALEMGRLDLAEQAVTSTLEAARSIVGELLSEAPIADGGLIRSEAALVSRDEAEAAG